MVRALLENEAGVKIIDMLDFSVYYHAFFNGYINIVNIFGEYKYNILNEL